MRSRYILGLLLIIVFSLSFSVSASKNNKVTICHIPPGNPDNAHTIIVSENAAQAHFAHGDEEGECGIGDGTPIFEVFFCETLQEFIANLAGQEVIFQHGIGFGTFAEAVAERDGEEAFFFLDGSPLTPVFYEGITLHSEPDFYGDRARVSWIAEPGTYTVQSYWSHPNEEAPGDSCTFSVN